MARLDCINGFNGLSCQRGCRLDCYLSMHGSCTPYYRRHACLHEHRLRTFSRRVGMLGCSVHFTPQPLVHDQGSGYVQFSLRPSFQPHEYPSKSRVLRTPLYLLLSVLRCVAHQKASRPQEAPLSGSAASQSCKSAAAQREGTESLNNEAALMQAQITPNTAPARVPTSAVFVFLVGDRL